MCNPSIFFTGWSCSITMALVCPFALVPPTCACHSNNTGRFTANSSTSIFSKILWQRFVVLKIASFDVTLFFRIISCIRSASGHDPLYPPRYQIWSTVHNPIQIRSFISRFFTITTPRVFGCIPLCSLCPIHRPQRCGCPVFYFEQYFSPLCAITLFFISCIRYYSTVHDPLQHLP